MSEYQPLRTIEEVDLLDMDDCLDGYRYGFAGGAEPGSDKSKSFWHGWRNGKMDRGDIPHDDASGQLARAYVNRQRAH